MIPTTHSKRRMLGFVGVLALIVGFVLYSNPTLYTKVKSFFLKGGNGLMVLQTIQKEISDSGKLIAGIDFPNAVLTKQGVYVFTNTERTQRGLKTLGSNLKLDRIATIRMNDMFAKQYFEHVSPSGDSASKEADVVSYEYITLGENIALGNFKDDNALVQAWMNSPGHRANILHTKFTEIGISVGKGMYEGKQTWIAVQVFGKPITACPLIDANLKTSIDARENQITTLQTNLAIQKQELDSMNTSGVSRATYNRKVDAYNANVAEINALIVGVKNSVAQYNQTVQLFNQCIDQTK